MLHYYFCLVELKNNANIWSIKIKNDGAFVNNESLVRKLDNDFNIDATFDNESDNLNLAYTEYCQKNPFSVRWWKMRNW
nr:hypothetical protein [Mycoplasmopsis bovis]